MVKLILIAVKIYSPKQLEKIQKKKKRHVKHMKLKRKKKKLRTIVHSIRN